MKKIISGDGLREPLEETRIFNFRKIENLKFEFRLL